MNRLLIVIFWMSSLASLTASGQDSPQTTVAYCMQTKGFDQETATSVIEHFVEDLVKLGYTAVMVPLDPESKQCCPGGACLSGIAAGANIASVIDIRLIRVGKLVRLSLKTTPTAKSKEGCEASGSATVPGNDVFLPFSNLIKKCLPPLSAHPAAPELISVEPNNGPPANSTAGSGDSSESDAGMESQSSSPGDLSSNPPGAAVMPPPPPLPPSVAAPGVTAVSSLRPDEGISLRMNTWGHIAFWSGCAGEAAGVVGLLLANAEFRDLRQDLSGDRDRIKLYGGLGIAGISLGSALLLTGVMLWLLDPEEPDSVVVDLQVDRSGGPLGLSLGWRW